MIQSHRDARPQPPARTADDVEVLVLTRSRDLLDTACEALRGRYRVRHAASTGRAEQIVRAGDVGVLVTNVLPSSLPRLLDQLRAWNPSLTVIAVARREQGHDQALMSLQASGSISRFLLDPVPRGQLALCVDAAARTHRERVQQSVEEARHLLMRVDARVAPPPRPRNRSVLPFSLAATIFMTSASGFLLFGQDKGADGPAMAAPPAALALDEDDRALSRALIAAKRAWDEGRFVDPPGDSAWYYYRQILAQRPNHREAARGVNELVNLMFTQAETALRAGDFEDARAALGRARRIAPSHPRLSVIGAQIDGTQQEQLLAAAVASARRADYARARELVEQADRVRAGESSQVREVRAQIATIQSENEQALQEAAIALEQALAAGQLLPPWAPNARDSLYRLRALRADDTLLRRYGDRLQDALAARATAAIAAMDFPRAERDVNGLASLADNTLAAVRAEELAMELADAWAAASGGPARDFPTPPPAAADEMPRSTADAQTPQTPAAPGR